MLAIQNGGTVTDFGGFVGNLPGSQGTATVSAGSTWTNASNVVVGGMGMGTLTIQDGGTVNSGGGGSIGLSAGSTGAVTVTGPGSTWNNSPGGGLNVGAFGTGTLTIANGGTVINDTPNTANIGEFAGSRGTVTVTGADSTWSNSLGVNIGRLGTGTLTVADGGIVNGPIMIATNPGSIGTLNIGAGVGNPAVAPGTLTAPSVAFGSGTGTINFNHTSSNYVFAPAISGGGSVNVLAGATILTADNSYTGRTTVSGGTLAVGDFAHPSAALSGGGPITVGSGGTLGGYGSVTGSVINSGVIAPGSATPGFAGSPMGAFTINGNYTGVGGAMALNTVLGGDGSPSDRLVISGGMASGSTIVHVTNVGGVGAETTGNGIQVVSAVGGATTAAGAFALSAGELRAGAFDYDLFRGGVSGSPNDWFLRSGFVSGGGGGGGGRRASCRSRHSPLTRRRTHCRPASSFRSSGPNSPPMGWCSLLRGNWGSASSARSTTGWATPTSRMVARLRRWSGRIACRPGKGRRPVPARCFRRRPGGASSGKRSTITTKPSPIRAPAATWAGSRVASIFCADR